MAFGLLLTNMLPFAYLDESYCALMVGVVGLICKADREPTVPIGFLQSTKLTGSTTLVVQEADVKEIV